MSLKGLILQGTVLLCLAAITSEIFQCGSNRKFCNCDYNRFIECGWSIILRVLRMDQDQRWVMVGMETECQNEIDSYKIGNPIPVPITDLALSKVPLRGQPTIYTGLSNLHEITDCVDMILIIPGFKINIKKKDEIPRIFVKLLHYLREKETDKSIYVLDVGEHFMCNYLDSVFKMSDIGRHLGESLAKIPNLKTLHIIGIDLGAHIAAYASRICNRINILKINRISALNPVSICIECRGAISKDLADFVDVYRTTDFYGYDEKNKDLASVIFQIRDEKTQNSYKTFLGSTEQAIDVFIDPLLGDKTVYTIKQCKDKKFEVCDKIMSGTDFGYTMRTVPPTEGNYVPILAERKVPKKNPDDPKKECLVPKKVC